MFLFLLCIVIKFILQQKLRLQDGRFADAKMWVECVELDTINTKHLEETKRRKHKLPLIICVYCYNSYLSINDGFLF